jgi:putative Mg2+ transporter-C (MgtC) family protein
MEYILDSNITLEQLFYIILLPLFLTSVIAYFIGFERQKIGKAAGISSHMLVAFASAAIAIMQRLLYEYEINYLGIQEVQTQRIIAQVLTGIGFIGAGVILKEKGSIRGITTATTIWSSAIIGLIFGSGFLVLGVIVGVAIFLFIFIRDLARGFNPFRKAHKNEELEDHL